MTEDLPEVGPWAREKLAGLRAYLSAYMTILSKHAPLRTVYVDAFAASGRAVVRKKDHDDPTIHLDLGEEARDEESRRVIDGSPRVALEIDPPFEQYVFIGPTSGVLPSSRIWRSSTGGTGRSQSDRVTATRISRPSS